MNPLARVAAVARNLFRRRERDADLDAEVRSYVELLVEEKIRVGLSPAEARRQARLESGGVEQVTQQVRESRACAPLDTLLQDVRYGLRQLRRNPGFAIVAIVTLALGIGANTAIFSIVDSVLLNPLPYPGVERMVFINETLPNAGYMNDSWPDFLDWQAQNRAFEGMTAVQEQGLTIVGAGEPRVVSGAYVSASFFPLLGAKPILGRVFGPSDDEPGAPAVAVVSYEFWRDVLHGDRTAVGKTFSVDHQATSVIGVLPPKFQFPGAQFQIYVPIGLQANDPNMTARSNHPGISVIATRREGVSLAAARADMATIMGRLARAYPKSDRDETAVLVPVLARVIGDLGQKLLMLLGAVGFILLLACANVANMMLARMAGRRREFAVRAALGASGSRLTRQLLAESLLLAGLGGTAGLLLAQWTIQPLARMYPDRVPGLADAHLNFTVFAFTFGVCIFATLLFGLAPAFQAVRARAGHALKDSGPAGTETRSRLRLRSALFVSEITAALVLLIGAGLTLRSLAAVYSVNPGFRADHLLALSVARPQSAGDFDPRDFEFFSQILDRISHLPGVESASAVFCPPFAGTNWTSPYVPAGRPAPPLNQQPWTALNMVMPNYFQTMRTPLLHGRYFTLADTADSVPVAVVNETMARTLDSRGAVIGKSVHVEYAAHPLLQIVGVVRDMKQWALELPNTQEVYVPAAQMPVQGMAIVVRTSVKPGALAHPAALAIQSLDKNLPVADVAPFSASIARIEANRTFVVFLLGAFGILAVLLAAIGVYGVMAYTVSQRTREFGIRIALGASRAALLRSVLLQSARLSMVGIVIGLALAAELAPLVATQLMLFEVQPRDVLTFAVASALLLAVALLACYIPARRATHVDPVTAIRCE